jgi:hypothetical protein
MMTSDGDFDLFRLKGQRQTAFSPNFETGSDSFADVCESLLPGVSLADTAWDGSAFGDPNTILIPFKSGYKLHSLTLLFISSSGKPKGISKAPKNDSQSNRDRGKNNATNFPHPFNPLHPCG